MNKKNLKKILGAALIVLLAAVMTVVYLNFREQPVEGSKSVTITVTGSDAKSTEYSLKTDAQFLLQAMEEAEGLTFSGTEGDFGLMIDTVNGEKADYSVDASYWAFYVNGEYCNYGVSEQPVEDGDAFDITYTK